jgi:flagellar M-ring protein FliF
MALANTGNIGAGFYNLPLVRQIGLMVGFAACIALAVAIVLWSQKPSYRMLYGNLPDQEVLEISTALDQAGIKYEVNQTTGAIMVDAPQVHEARMKLAASGLPKGSGTGYELMDKDQGFGTSQFVETTRYQRAVEGELAKTIGSLTNVQSARVHLAIPKQSAFVRDRKKPTASVMLSLYQGRVMSPDQASSIAHLVASSIPNLEVEDVTVVDQTGRLLTKSEGGDEMGRSSTQFEYRKNLEEYYMKRILEIVEPIIGAGKVKAQVAADLDFTVTEQTQESYNPDLPSIRSEQTVEEENIGAAGTNGVPGTLSNQPAQAGSTVAPTAADAASGAPKNSARRSVRNYELDKTISHTRHQVGALKRLSAAIVIDEKATKNEAGEVSSKPLSKEEMDKITSLVKEAIGFDAARGDSVNVINVPFLPPPEPEAAAETSLLDQPWLWDAGKQLLGIGAVVLLIFVVLKPVLKSLAEKGVASETVAMPAMMGPDGQMVALGNGQMQQMLSGPSYEQQLEIAKAIAKQEPHRVAHIVKEWVEKDG